MPIHPPKQSIDAGDGLVFEKHVKRAVGSIVVRRFCSDVESSVFEELAPFHAIWRSKLRDDGLPRWKDFDFEEFVGWHRIVGLGDITSDDADPVFRIYGSGAAELMGKDLTGQKLSHAVPAAEADGIIGHFSHIRDEKLIGTVTGKMGMQGREFLDFKVIELPLENDAGEVTQILFCYLGLPQQA